MPQRATEKRSIEDESQRRIQSSSSFLLLIMGREGFIPLSLISSSLPSLHSDYTFLNCTVYLPSLNYGVYFKSSDASRVVCLPKLASGYGHSHNPQLTGSCRAFGYQHSWPGDRYQSHKESPQALFRRERPNTVSELIVGLHARLIRGDS
jgi:hypothetical protein